MSAPYVCPSCRRNVLRHTGSLRRLSHTSKATFISFTSKIPRQNSDPKNAESSLDIDERSGPSLHTAQSEKRPFESRASPVPPPPSHARPTNPSRAEALSSLFHVLDNTNTPGRYSGALPAELDSEQPTNAPQRKRFPKPMSQISQIKPVASELDEILHRNGKTTIEAWEYFQRQYPSPDCEALKSPHLVDVPHVVTGKVFRKLLRALVNDWCAGNFEDALPDPFQVIERFSYLGIMREEPWHHVLWLLNMHAFKRLNGIAEERPGRSLDETIVQLMKAWNRFLEQFASFNTDPQRSAPSVEAGPPAEMWSSLPSPRVVREATRRHVLFATRLRVFFPTILPNVFSRISYSALVTFDILTRDAIESAVDEAILTDFRPFSVFLAHLIPGSQRLAGSQTPSLPDVMRSLVETSGIPQAEIAAFSKRIAESSVKAMTIIGAYGSSGETNRELRSPQESLGDFYFRRIARACSQRKPQDVQQIWIEARRAMIYQDRNAHVVNIPSKLYNLVLESLLTLRHHESAIKVWNQMLEDGIHPTVKTWTSMLDGCGKARDIHGLEQMWIRMLNAGVQPDVYAWSARISGIMNAGKTEHGLRVLEEMGKIWVDAYKRAQPSRKKRGQHVDEAYLPARPSTVILNGAITALSQRPPREHRYVARVLAWGRSFGIKPDVITFNALISMSLANDNAQEAMKLLQQMEEVQVQPDIATFTIILNSIFRSSSTAALSQEEQNGKVMAVLQNLESRGIEANAHVYSTLIDGLLRRHGNEQAARAVLNHMAAKKVEISPHVYTILMTYYFEREDFDAIEALWTQIQASGSVVDLVFYDRMIERYAEIGETGKMTTFLTHMSKEGLTPGWPALQAVVETLADIGDWDRFDEIVSDVENGVGIASRGLKKSDENVINRFWKAVESKKKQRPNPYVGLADPTRAS